MIFSEKGMMICMIIFLSHGFRALLIRIGVNPWLRKIIMQIIIPFLLKIIVLKLSKPIFSTIF